MKFAIAFALVIGLELIGGQTLRIVGDLICGLRATVLWMEESARLVVRDECLSARAATQVGDALYGSQMLESVRQQLERRTTCAAGLPEHSRGLQSLVEC